jgi:hypothetical protein
MPWVEGKLSIHQLEFLAEEFGGDTESVQRGLAPATREYYMCRCAEIVHDENHYEETNDSRFNNARKYMAKLILESYGKTEDGYRNEHKE